MAATTAESFRKRIEASRRMELKLIIEQARDAGTELVKRVQAFLDDPLASLPDGFEPETGEAIFISGSYKNLDAATRFFKEKNPNVYARNGSPAASTLFESIITYLDPDAVAGAVIGHGMGAISTVTLGLIANGKLKPGDKIVISNDIFAGCRKIFDQLKSSAAIEIQAVDGADLDEWEDAVTEDTKLVFIETPGNPCGTLVDVDRWHEIVRSQGHPNVLTVADLSLEYLAHTKEFSLLKRGVDIVVASLTKSLGLGADPGGILYMSQEGCDRLRDLPRHEIRVADYTQGSVTVHYEEIPETEPNVNILVRHIAQHGHTLAPRVAFELLKNLLFLEPRYDRQSANAKILANHIHDLRDRYPDIRVLSPYLPDHRQADLAKRQMKGGMVFSVNLRSYEHARTFVDTLAACDVKLINNFGSPGTTISHPAGTTHATLTEPQRREQGIGPGIVRISVGVEDIKLLLKIFNHALSTTFPKAATARRPFAANIRALAS